jgi:hypothetical protein
MKILLPEIQLNNLLHVILRGSKILLGISGGIAAINSIIRHILAKAGVHVR